MPVKCLTNMLENLRKHLDDNNMKKVEINDDTIKRINSLEGAFKKAKEDWAKKNKGREMTDHEEKQIATNVALDYHKGVVNKINGLIEEANSKKGEGQSKITPINVNYSEAKKGLNNAIKEYSKTIKSEQNAIPKPSTGEVLQRQSGGDGEQRGERGRVEQSLKGESSTTESKPTEQKAAQTEQSGGSGGSSTTNKDKGSGGENVGGLAQRVQEERRGLLGINTYKSGEGWTKEEALSRGKELEKEGLSADDIISNFKKDGRISPDEMARLQYESIKLAKETSTAEDKFSIDSKEYKDALAKENEFLDSVQPIKTASSKIFSAQQGAYNLDTESFSAVKKAAENNIGDAKLTKKQEGKIKELTETNKKLKTQLDETEKKLIAETDAHFKTKEESKKTYSEKAKKVADTFRKLKTKEFTFKDENGNEIPIQKMGVSWNELVELGAKAIEKTGEIADGVKEILDRVKDEDWYKNLSDKDKERFKKQLNEHYGESVKDTPEAQNIKRLEKELEKLQNGEAKQQSPKREISEKEKELQEKIRDEKEKLGLVKSKQEKPLTEDEQIEQDKKELEGLQKQFVDKKGNKFTYDEAKSIWDYGKKNYLDRGSDFIDMVINTSKDLGLSVEQVAKAIDSPKSKENSIQYWKKQYDLRRGRQITKDYIESQNRSPLFKLWRKISSVPRSIVTALHGHVYGGTHYPMGIITPTDWNIYFKGIANMAKSSYGSRGEHEMFLRSIENDPNYSLALKSGLKVDVNSTNTDDFEKPNTLFGEKAKAIGEVGTRGFAGFKDLRLKMFNKYWENVPENEKNKETAETIAYLMNLATGASNNKIPTVLQEGLFSAGMESARWGKLFKTPALAVDASIRIMKSLKNGQEPRPQDKVLLKVWGSRVGQQLAMYAGALALSGYIQNTLYPNNKINVTDPTKSDFLKFKIGNTTIGLDGGIIGIINLLSSLYEYTSQSKTRQVGEEKAGQKVLKYGLGKASPLVGDIAEIGLGADFSGNPLPWSNKKAPSYGHKLSYGEYFGSKAPIFIEGTISNIYKGAEEQGLNKTKTDKIINGILQFAATAGIGVHAKESYEDKSKKIFTDSDKQKPSFKYFLDKGIELPQTSSTSEEIKDKEEGTVKKISDFPKEKINEYEKLHKQLLEEELNDVLKDGYVYVDKIGDVSFKENIYNTPMKIDKLDDIKLEKVLKLAQSHATKEAKKEVFKNNE